MKSVVAAAVSAAALALWLREEGALSAICSAVAALAAIGWRTAYRQRLYEISACFLRTERECRGVKPDTIQQWGFGTALLAVRCAVWVILLLPAVFCLHEGAAFYALSGRRELFLLLLNAALCLTVSGVLSAVMVTARLSCAEYLYFSGECGSAVSALDGSWLLTSGAGGEAVIITVLSPLCGSRMAGLCRMNFAERLTRAYGADAPEPRPREWRLEWVRDSRGEQRFEIG